MDNEEKGLEENDQRVFMVVTDSREEGRFTGKLHCGFCRGAGEPDYWSLIRWYPGDPQQSVVPKAMNHFRSCPHRGGVTSFPMRVFEGEHDKVGSLVTIAVK